MIISRLRAFGAFWYDFVVGDDWLVAAGVVLALFLTWLLARSHATAAWWIVPVAVVVLLPVSIARLVRRSG